MKQLLLVLGIAILFFAQNLFAREDLSENGRIFPTPECKTAVYDFLYPNPNDKRRPQEKGDDVKSYPELVGDLDKEAENRLAVFSTRRLSAKKNKRELEIIAADERKFNDAANKLTIVCGGNIEWSYNTFQIRFTEGGFLGQPANPEVAQ
jgi:hypothetical protein